MGIRAFFSHIQSVITFNQLPKNQKTITFYSEGRNYWSYLGGLMREVLKCSDIFVCYVSSSPDDPGLKLKHPRLKVFLIDEGFVRDWFFANMETDVVVMTMPDINQYQVKRSKHEVHYIYVQHSLVSFHMVYRPGAFDYYDTVFCAGPHHLKEMREIESVLNVPKKALFEHGYARLDAIKSEALSKKNVAAEINKKFHYLLAPSWGENGTIETGVGAKIVDLLLKEDKKVTLRPHPQTIKFHPKKIDEIVSKHIGNPNFKYENGVLGQDSLHDSDVMICDWSGAALDYAFGLEKPVIFIDVERKINNPHYKNITIEPFEVSVREKIGVVFSINDLENIIDFVPYKLKNNVSDDYVFNVGNSDTVGAKEIVRIAGNLT